MTYFDEKECEAGGSTCGAWHDWFTASDDADPTAIDEGRDPKGLADVTFHPVDCHRPDTCPLYVRCKTEMGLA